MKKQHLKTAPFAVEQTYNAFSQKVWQAITDKDEMKKWYFDLPAFKPEAGFEFEFNGGPPEKSYLHKCVVTKVVTGKLLAHTWRYEGYPGNSEVTWELFDEGDKTRIKLTHSGLHTFPAEPDFARDNFAIGWTHITGVGLKEFLEK